MKMWAGIRRAAACVTAAALLGALAPDATAQERGPAAEKDLPRIGFEESFDTADGWKHHDRVPLKSVEVKDGTVRFNLHRSALSDSQAHIDRLMTYPENKGKKIYGHCKTYISKDYDVAVDFGTYRYMVIKIDERATYVQVSVCGYYTPLGYTTGVRVVDLHTLTDIRSGEPADLTSPRKPQLYITFMSNGGWATFDYIRFVRELTEEERKGLLPPPAEFKKENLTAHPYHELEAMNARAGRTRRAECEGQLLTYRDTLSGGEVWKLTDQPGAQDVDRGGGSKGWTPDGRYFQVRGGRGGRNVWDAGEGKWYNVLPSEDFPHLPPQYTLSWRSCLRPEICYGYNINWAKVKKGKGTATFVFHRFDRRTGQEEALGEFRFDYDSEDVRKPFWACRAFSSGSTDNDRVVVELRDTYRGILVDPGNPEPAGRVQPIELPVRCEGLVLIRNDTFVLFGNNTTYEQLEMNLATGEVSLRPLLAFTHAGGSKLFSFNGGTVRCNLRAIRDRYRPGDNHRLFTYYRESFGHDYGGLIDGDRWWLVNGTSGDVENQHILIDGENCATILRLNGINVSHNDWSTTQYSGASPDATKVYWMSDQLGDGDVQYVVARRPDPPQKVWLRNKEGVIRLSWYLPERSEETAGFVIYGAGKDNLFRPLDRKLVRRTTWAGEVPEDVTRFVVAAREWSGLEGFLSPVQKLESDTGPDALHLDVWLGVRSETARVVFGRGSFGTRSVRYFKANVLETMPATVTWEELSIPKGELCLFAHQRPDGASGDWEWKRLKSGFKVEDDSVSVEVPPGILLDKVVVTNDRGYEPRSHDDRFPPPPAVKDVKALVAADGLVTLAWEKPASIELSHVEIHSGPDRPLACNNTTVVGAVTAAQEPHFFDWDLKPGSTVCYSLVPVSTRGRRGEPVTAEVKIPTPGELVCVGAGLEKAKPGAGLKVVERNGEQFYAPEPVRENADPEPETFVPLDFSLDVPVDGKYSIWVRCSPGYTTRRLVSVSLDGGKADSWRVRAPYREMSFTTEGKTKVFTDRLVLGGQDAFELKKGNHVLRFLLDPAAPGGHVHAIGKVWISNDPSFRPEGYNPRADFGKGKYDR